MKTRFGKDLLVLNKSPKIGSPFGPGAVLLGLELVHQINTVTLSAINSTSELQSRGNQANSAVILEPLSAIVSNSLIDSISNST